MEPKGTIVFTTVGRPYYGFDIFSVKLPLQIDGESEWYPNERRLTDGISINYNGQFVDDDGNTLVYVSEKTGSPRIYLLTSSGSGSGSAAAAAHPIPTPHESLFHDRPLIKHGRLFFISAHEQPKEQLRSWSALYSIIGLHDHDSQIVRFTPYGSVDYSPAISQTGKYIAVASYGSRPWAGEFHDLQTDIVVFPISDPTNRTLVCQHGGWPTWSGDSTIYFHRQADDGWWSVFKVDLPENFQVPAGTGTCRAPVRVTPQGVHCFTPAAMHNSSKKIAVATRRRESSYRHIEIFDMESHKFHPVSELINPDFHHYNPFVSPGSNYLGYHRFRGKSPSLSASDGESIIPHLDPVTSPIKGIRMLRLNGSFPSFSPSGKFVAFNHDFDTNSGLKVVKSDGSKRWTLFKNRTTFYNSWSPAEENVIFTSIGPIFDSVKATVQIARVSFDTADLVDDRDEIPVEMKILTDDKTGNNAFPSCSPDGRHVVFRSGRSGHKNLYIVDAAKGEVEGEIRQLTEGAWIDTMPSWSPKGDLIAFSSNRHNPENVDAFSIYVIRPDGSGLRRVYVAVGEEAKKKEGSGPGVGERERLNHVCFSGDGEWLLFTANLGGITAEPVSLPNHFQPYGDLHMVRLDGSGLRRLTWNGYENGTPAWHPGRGTEEMDFEFDRLCLSRVEESDGDRLEGQFDEPLWINFNF